MITDKKILVIGSGVSGVGEWSFWNRPERLPCSTTAMGS